MHGPDAVSALPSLLLSCVVCCLQGYALRNDINARLQNITKITTERYREHAAERKAKREVGYGWWAGLGGGLGSGALRAGSVCLPAVSACCCLATCTLPHPG